MKTSPFCRPAGLGLPGRLYSLAAGALALVCIAGSSQAAEPLPASAILPELRAFRQMGSVLFIAAHPDDENTQLITFLARGRAYRTAYLSLTRGDGGQNVLGPELGDELGVIRTQELLAARRLDGGRQFFSRAIDFGFSKDYRETLRIWDRQQVLADIVRVIRLFRPDVLITRFSPVPSGTHGHHTASAVLAVEAFKLAGDPGAFPEQLGSLKPWPPKRILWNGGGRGPEPAATAGMLRLEVGGNDPPTSESFGEIAARSRAMHQTQGFGNFGGFGNRGARSESFQLLAGEPASQDILEGVDTTWGRVPGGAEIGRLTDDIIGQYDPKNPAGSVPALLALRLRLTTLPPDPVVDEKRGQLDRILAACLGLSVQTETPRAEVTPGETLHLHHTAMVRSAVPVRWVAVRYPGSGHEIGEAVALRPDQAASRDTDQTLPAGTRLSQPYWLREDHPPGMFRVDDPALIGRPENPPVFPIEHRFEVGGQTLLVPDEPVQVMSDPAAGEVRRRLDVIAPVSLRLVSDVGLFARGSARTAAVEVVAGRADIAGTVQLDAPAGWRIEPAAQPFRLAAAGDQARFNFNLVAPAQAVTADITARALVRGARFGNQRLEIRYRHIPVQVLQPPARLKAVCLDLAIRGHQVGYVAGAGDRVGESLEQMGYAVTPLAGADLTPERLRGLDAVVIGIRAFNVRTDLVSRLPALFAYVEAGGTVVAQYNRPEGLRTNQVTPYSLRLSQERVTDETAPVTFLTPDHPALNTPNKITAADFADWVQERGVYFPNQWDEHFIPILACGDPGETPLPGGLLVAPYGRGYFGYTGLAFFRQLPAGVPGAFRLFANLVSLGK